MKKIALTSLLAVFAATAANAANTYDFNPLYRPSADHFYSATSLGTDSDTELFALGEEFGYGITDKLSAFLNTSASAFYPSSGDNDYSWDNFGLGLSYRYVDDMNWKADIYGKVAQLYSKDGGFNTYAYDWRVGTKLGYVADNWTLAATAEYQYTNDDVPAYNYDETTWNFGLDGQYNIDDNWNVTAGLTYTLYDNNSLYAWLGEDDNLDARVGVNYNIDPSKVVGLYAMKSLTSDIYDKTGFGVKFGIDF